MRIGISCYSTYGGSGVVAAEIGKALAARDHEVHILSPSLPPRLIGFEDHVTFHEVSASPYPLFETDLFSIALASMMADVADRHKLDIIHAHYAIPHASAALLARMALDNKIKVVTTLHGTDITAVGTHPSYLPMVKLAIRDSDAVTAVSEYLKQETIKKFNVSRHIDVVYNFVYQTHSDETIADCRPWLSPDRAPLVTHISNFRPVKRVMDVMKVFNAVHQKIPCKLLMVGDGPDRMEAENYAREMNIDSDVRFTGKQLDIASALACSDVFLLPSATESFGLAALEAMSHGVPVVASRVGGIPEVIRDGIDGYLSVVGNIEQMAENVTRLISDARLRSKMGSTAKARARDTFAEDPVVDKYLEIYQRVLGI